MDIMAALSGGDRRSLGRTKEVASHILAQPTALPDLIGALGAPDPIVRMRAGDALERISKQNADWLAPYAAEVMAAAADPDPPEMRWHAAHILPRLGLDGDLRQRAVGLMFDCLGDNSRIARAWALTALVAFADGDGPLRIRVLPLVRDALVADAPAVRARARKLMQSIEKNSNWD